MCNLNVIVKSKIKDRIIKSLPAFLMGVTKSSYNFNSDGDGIYLDNKNKLFKGKKKFIGENWRDGYGQQKDFCLCFDCIIRSNNSCCKF